MMNTPTPTGVTADTAKIDEQHPWLGLESFTEATRGYFYGRDDEVGELARRVQRKLLTVLFGQSGLGKTSILRAGIVPRLRPEGYCPVYVRIDYSPEAPSPTEQIKQAIFAATAASGSWTGAGTAVEGESLWEFLHHRDDILKDANGKTVIPLLIFDQFEEVFTLAQADDVGRSRAAGFIEDLADLVENRLPKKVEALLEEDDTITERFDFNREDYRVLIALREDYLAHLESVKGVMPSITQNRMRLARMTGSQALSAVLKPGGKLVSQEVAESIVRFVAGGSELPNAEVEPSLLSLICRELNNARIARGRSEISVDLLAGSHDTILAEFYERALADQPPAVRKVIEDELLTESGYRENLAEERIQKAFATAGASPDALATLVNRRLLRTEDRLDRRRVELTHDVLCGVVKASREARLAREAREQAETNLLAQQQREHATRKALIRARQIAAGCALLSVVAIGSAIYGVYSANRAHQAETQAVNTRAISEASRVEAEKLVVFILDDFYEEMVPIGRLDVVGSLAKQTVDYYRQLPLEARTHASNRNSALAQSRYARVLTTLGKSDEASGQIAAANKTLAELRAGGDDSDETIIVQGRVGAEEGFYYALQFDMAAAIKVGEATLASLKPLLTRPTPPELARRVESELRGRLGFAYLRHALLPAAIDNLQQTRAYAKQQGAAELRDLVATAGYVASGWMLAEALARSGRSDQALPLLKESIELADRLLQQRPGHRPALRSKATSLNQLGTIEEQNLRVASALRYTREAVRTNAEVTALDPGSSGSQNNLRLAKSGVSRYQYLLGSVDESIASFQSALDIDKSETVSGFSARQLIWMHGQLARLLADAGQMDRATASLRAAEQYLQRFLSLSNDTDSRLSAQGELAAHRARIDAINGKFDAVEPEMAKHIALRLQRLASLGDQRATGRDVPLATLYAVTAAALLGKGDYAAAAQYAHKQLEEVRRDAEPSLSNQRDASVARTRLALALARQTKLYDAHNTIRPALAFFRLPAVQRSDDVTLKHDYAYALLAAAVANPADKSALLAEALRTFEAMPAQMKAQKTFARLREDIVREQGRKP